MGAIIFTINVKSIKINVYTAETSKLKYKLCVSKNKFDLQKHYCDVCVMITFILLGRN